MGQSHLFTSESVTEGHPDKIADQISDGVLDAVLADDPLRPGRLRDADHDRPGDGGRGDLDLDLRRHPLDRPQHDPRIGYDRAKYGFDCDTCGVSVAIDEQSPDIAQGVDHALEARGNKDSDPYDLQGAGDQGLMFGYASDETAELMPLPIILAHRLCERLAAMRRTSMTYLRPDGKSQVTVRYEDGVPDGGRVGGDLDPARAGRVGRPPARRGHRPGRAAGARGLRDAARRGITYYINPTGTFVVGGPLGDCGLTGRKIIVDTYGGMARHGGGAFSRQGPVEGRPLGRLRRPLGGEERGRRGLRRGAARCRWPTRSASPTRSR